MPRCSHDAVPQSSSEGVPRTLSTIARSSRSFAKCQSKPAWNGCIVDDLCGSVTLGAMKRVATTRAATPHHRGARNCDRQLVMMRLEDPQWPTLHSRAA